MMLGLPARSTAVATAMCLIRALANYCDRSQLRAPARLSPVCQARSSIRGGLVMRARKRGSHAKWPAGEKKILPTLFLLILTPLARVGRVAKQIPRPLVLHRNSRPHAGAQMCPVTSFRSIDNFILIPRLTFYFHVDLIAF